MSGPVFQQEVVQPQCMSPAARSATSFCSRSLLTLTLTHYTH
jgi:hypothetical protein